MLISIKSIILALFFFSCNLIIEKYALASAFDTLKELEIRNTNLGSDQLINNLVRHFTNITNLSLEDNYIKHIDPVLIPQSVKTFGILTNKFECNCTTVRALESLSKRVTISQLDALQIKGCPDNANVSIGFQKALIHCLSIIAERYVQ